MRMMVPPTKGLRPEVQALRAAAVLLVVLYHLWPDRLPGGYVGVDVFFVISGFLITSHLMREVDRSGRISLSRFWARRARRLLPAALLVLVVSAIGTLLWMPVAFWNDFFQQMVGAVTYILNWMLAADSVDYLAAEAGASPVQHYWSLAVEEQFYLVWPPLILLALWLGRRLGRRRAIIVALTAVTVASFATSVWMTAAEPGAAYFVTTTRAWEFGVGALLVFVPSLGPKLVHAVVGWLGIAFVAASGFLFDATTPFPGWTALGPVLATAAVIWAGNYDARGSVAHISRFRPIQYVGDISYSLYLWHWPPIIIVPFAFESVFLRFTDKVAILAACIVLAAVTKKFVEDPVRLAQPLTSRQPRITYAAAAAAMVVALIVPVAGWATTDAEQSAAANEVVDYEADCFGARAVLDAKCDRSTNGHRTQPNLAEVMNDNAEAYGCFARDAVDGNLETCTYGSKDEDAIRVAITGDSHAVTMMPAMEANLDELGWTLDTYLAVSCTWTVADAREDCREYRELLQDRLIEGAYDIVITTSSRKNEAETGSPSEVAQLRADAWGPVIDSGTEVVALSDNPRLPERQVYCVLRNPEEAQSGEDCVIPRDDMMKTADSHVLAASLEPRAHLVDLTDLYCNATDCPMVIGDVVVYRDSHHLTRSYVLTLADELVSRITESVGSADPAA